MFVMFSLSHVTIESQVVLLIYVFLSIFSETVGAIFILDKSGYVVTYEMWLRNQVGKQGNQTATVAINCHM